MNEIRDIDLMRLPPIKPRRFRVTRDSAYGPGSAGHNDLSAREGHYVKANSEQEALAIVRLRFPFDSGRFTVQSVGF